MRTMHWLAVAFVLCTTAGFAACSKGEPVTVQRPDSEHNGSNRHEDDGKEEDEEAPASGHMNIRIGNRTFTVALADNETARAFGALLPLTVTMNELNGNEKYSYLSESLPTAACRPGTIREGDLMLYGSDCLVLFYKTFSSSYSYTRIGRADNPAGLAETVGAGDVNATFELSDQK